MSTHLLSTRDVAAELGLHVETIRRLHRTGRIPAYRCGRVYRFDPDEVRDALRTSATDGGGMVQPNFDALDEGVV
jgi:excisionase family DNA binding protein